MKKIFLNSLHLNDYRNFDDLHLVFDKNVVVIIGDNGSGKTNILESISLLAPGRGLRGANYDLICRANQTSWSSVFNLQSKLGIAEITNQFSLQSRNRSIQYNGSKVTNNELIKLANISWITPQMDGIFLGGRVERKKLLDRIVYNFDPGHAKNIISYDYYNKERFRTLTKSSFAADSSLLNMLEEKMAICAQAIFIARNKAIDVMQDAIDKIDSKFPKAILKVSKLFAEKTDDFIGLYKKELASIRTKDAYSGRTNFGVQKADLIVMHQGKNEIASLCSTGEQKAMLVAIILAQINAIISKTANSPILLLDELFVHLDDMRKEYLADYILSSKIQTFITATDTNGIKKLSSQSQIIEISI